VGTPPPPRQIAPGRLARLIIAPEIRIVSMTDPTNTKTYLDKIEPYDAKREGATMIRIRLGAMRSASLTVEYDPGSQVHAAFYGAYSELTAPVVARLPVPPAAGVHDISWSGRDDTPDHRILLAGTYKLRLRGESTGVAVDEVREFTVPAPRGWNYGLDFRNRRGVHEDSRPEVQAAENGQKQLSDGTGYDVTTTTSASAQDASDAWSMAGVGHFGSHSSPGGLLFIEGGSNRSDLEMVSEDDSVVSVARDMGDLLEDMLLLCLAGCRGGNETLVIQVRLNQLRNALDCGTPDGDIGDKTQLALRTAQRVAKLPLTSQLDLATQALLGVGPEPVPSEPTIIAAQRKLRSAANSCNAGREDGKWGNTTETAVRNFQRFVRIPETGLPDAETRDRLMIGPGHATQLNIADAMRRTARADVVIGFVTYTYFDSSIDWARVFWGNLAQGQTIEDAAAAATASLRPQRRPSAQLNIYADPLVGAGIKLLPARYGRARF
jgi:peptidoglycan hydrolase-like protein with peptidoglycan-binding domain